MFSNKNHSTVPLSVSAKTEEVNPEQAKAIRHKNGPMMVLAGPGSGKTFVITRRLRCMIREYGIPPEEILVITFTRAAALEMQERFLKLMQDESQGVVFGTFHAVYFSILKNACHFEASSILTEKEKRRYLKECFSAYPDIPEDEHTFSYVLSAFSSIKNDGIEPEAFRDGCNILDRDTFLAIYHEYHSILRAEGKLDFDDMVLQCRDLFRSHPEILSVWQKRYRYILIDEFQDINPMQYEVIKMLAEPEYNLFIVGDDDQSIYGFRGSAPEIMLGFPKEFPDLTQVLLKNNYRSTQGIVDSALRLVEHNTKRFPKKLHAQKTGQNDVNVLGFDSPEEEAKAVTSVLQSARACMDYKDMALLFRTNASAAFYSQKLSAAGIPFYLREKITSVFSGSVGQDILAMFSYAHGEHTRRLLLRFLNKPARYIRRSLLEEEDCDLYALLARQEIPATTRRNIRRLLQDLALLRDMHPFAGLHFIRKGMGYESWLMREAREKGRDAAAITEILDLITASTRTAENYEDWLEQIEAYEAALSATPQEQDRDAVQLVTMHASKGLEYRMVILPDVNEGTIPQKRAEKTEDLEEERRVFYVAMTRAKEKLFLFYLKKNPERRISPSRFLKEIS